MSRVLLAGVAVAGVAATTSAFTNSNTFNATGALDAEVGYGELAVTGVTVSNVAYNPVAGDATKLDTVVFSVVEDVTDTNSYLTLTGVSATLPACTPSGSTTPYLITCDAGDSVIQDITKVALTVVSK